MGRDYVVKNNYKKDYTFRRKMLEAVHRRRESCGDQVLPKPDLPPNIAPIPRQDKQIAIAQYQTRFGIVHTGNTHLFSLTGPKVAILQVTSEKTTVHDRAAPVKTHICWAMKTCGGEAARIRGAMDNKVYTYVLTLNGFNVEWRSMKMTVRPSFNRDKSYDDLYEALYCKRSLAKFW
ncbi:Hypp6112 [Branchiostoma lanceolatum]|uniref:Hypp6112 protein n=1 Tax=Branchiostoma lanceolatum TaxID=7740 RepID=A0A8J9YQ28_BRALA|nr:Hypp6112 [Branchiostoma lanceolatum]